MGEKHGRMVKDFKDIMGNYEDIIRKKVYDWVYCKNR